MSETFGDTICGQGPCSNDRNGKVFSAAEWDDTTVRDDQGEIVCRVGQCAQDILSGEIMCSREPGGDALNLFRIYGFTNPPNSVLRQTHPRD